MPDTITLEEIDAHAASGVLVAVGRDAGGDAAIFRRAGGTWIADAVSIPGATDSALVDVAVAETAAWAVGTYEDGTGTKPLALRIGGGEAALEGGGQATWSAPPEALPGGTDPRAVSLWETTGLIGTAAGTVIPFDDASADAIKPTISPAQAAGPVNAIAQYDATHAFTAGDDPAGDGADRVHQVELGGLGGDTMLPVLAGASDPDLNLVGIAADSATSALAVEGNPGGTADPGEWSPQGGIWQRSGISEAFTEGSQPSDLSLAKVNVQLTWAVAGVHGGAGAVWRRAGNNLWSRDDAVSASPLNGVAALGEKDIWAVGDPVAQGDVIKRYAPLANHAPPETVIDAGGPSGQTSNPNATFAFHSAPAGASFECRLIRPSDPDPIWAGCTSAKSYSGLELGSHTFQVRGKDDAGAVDPSPAQRGFTVVPPETYIASGPLGTTNDQTPTFSFYSDLGSAGFQCSVDGSAFSACSSPVTTGQLGEGSHTFLVQAVSSAGADPSPAARTFTVDLPDPACTEVPRPLTRNVVVRKRKGKGKRKRKRYLKISFDLVANARVKAKAFDDGKLIGRTKERVLKQGSHTIKLRYRRGKPSRLKMLVRPADPNACQ